MKDTYISRFKINEQLKIWHHKTNPRIYLYGHGKTMIWLPYKIAYHKSFKLYLKASIHTYVSDM